MGLLSWLHLRNTSGRLRARERQRPSAPCFRPLDQALEDRCMLSGYQQINLGATSPAFRTSRIPT
jgi:hypothetical protein